MTVGGGALALFVWTLGAEFMLHGLVACLLFDSFGIFLSKRLEGPFPSPPSASS